MNQNEIRKVKLPGNVFEGYKLEFDSEHPRLCEHSIVYRPQNTLFSYCSWPSVCSDENGVLYAAAAAFRMEHVCPFGKIAMFISKDQGKTWSCPIIVVDSYLEDGFGGGGLLYLGDGKMLLSWCTKPAVTEFNEYYNRLKGKMYKTGRADAKGLMRAAMVDYYPQLPPEQLMGGAFVKVSEDYGMTWSDPIRVPVTNVHGACKLKDGSVMLLGKGFFPDDSESRKWIESGFSDAGRFQAEDWNDWAVRLNESAMGKMHRKQPVSAIVSEDGGYTWKERGTCPPLRGLKNECTQEPHAVQLPDGSVLGVMRVEDEESGENEFTVYTTRSEDGGYTWSEWTCTHISGSPPHILLHSSGALVCTVGRRAGNPLGQFAAISYDGGKSWTREIAINDTAPNNDLGYPATTELPDGSLVTVYYQVYTDPVTGARDQRPCIQCTHWTL